MNSYQLAINEINSLKISYIDSSLSIMVDSKYPTRGPFFYYISKELMNYFGDDGIMDKKYWKRNFGDLMLYLKIGLDKNIGGDYIIPKYYAERFKHCYSNYLANDWRYALRKKIRYFDVILYLRKKLLKK